MPRSVVERRLVQVSSRLRQSREQLAVLEEQLAALADDADEARIRALISETPLADREHESARRHFDAMARSREDLRSSIASLERSQQELLDRLVPGPS